jgi:hypothetical protein
MYFTNVASATGSNSSWVQLSGNYTLNVTETLTELSIYFEGPDSGTNLYVDDVSFKIYTNSSQEKYGDLNNDGTINTIDFAILKQYLLGMQIDINLQMADLDGDKSVTAMDLAVLKKYLLGQITELPLV